VEIERAFGAGLAVVYYGSEAFFWLQAAIAG
jgi:hypothetical protein